MKKNRGGLQSLIKIKLYKMITIQRNLVEMMSKTDLATDSKTKETFNKIIYNAFEKSDTNLEDTVLLTLAYKYELECFEEMMSVIETEKDRLPF
jgi:hypothetical protein